jgi:hypothetical protein
VHPTAMGNPMLEAEAAGRVERVLKLLSLVNCADTVVGNDMLRGVSGGEKKRVTSACRAERGSEGGRVARGCVCGAARNSSHADAA